LVLDVSDTIQTKVRVALTEEDRANGDSSGRGVGIRYGEVDFAHVVYEPGDGKDVKCAKSSLLYI
jgi:hypothetical protein